MNSLLAKKIMVSLQCQPKNVWRLLEELDCNAKELAETLCDLIKERLVAEKKGVLSTLQKPCWNPKIFNQFFFPARQFFDSNNKLFKRFQFFGKNFKPANNCFNQQRVTNNDLFNKLALMTLKKDIVDASIALLGDDDLFSLALALTALPKKITVFELDEKVIGHIQKIADQEDFQIKIVRHNFSKPLPKKFVGKFDGFVTEQPEARIGLYAFLRSGTQALQPNGWGYFTLTRIESSWQKWRRLQADLTRNGFAVTDILEGFSTYLDGETEENLENMPFAHALPFKVKDIKSDVFTAALIRIQSTGSHSPLTVPKPKKGESFFVDNETFLEEPAKLKS